MKTLTQDRIDNLLDRFNLLDNETQNDIWYDSNAADENELVLYLHDRWSGKDGPLVLKGDIDSFNYDNGLKLNIQI